MNKKPFVFDLPEDRLATTTETGKRVYLYPADVRGKFRKLRNFVYDALIILFLALPWIKVNGSPLLLLDIVHRQFSIFGLHFWADEAPMLVFVFGGIFLGIAFITAVFGRLWCGWACPQTVFIDRVYRRIEGWIEGSAAERRRLDSAPLSLEKIIKKLLKYLSFLAVSLIIANSFLAYFVGIDAVQTMITQSPFEHPSAFILVVIATLITLFDFGWFREQFCVIACPYGRLQSVMIDGKSLIVAYNEKRGEPRKKDRHDDQATGDCINCYRCVQVCPTGIDIRRGLQMECIMCTGCIDACDEVMTKLNKPTGLISYTTEEVLQGKKRHWFKPRLLVYTVLIALFISGLTYTISTRKPLRVYATRGRSAYQVTQQHTVINHFKLHVYNYQFVSGHLSVRLKENNPNIKFIMPSPDLNLPSGKTKTFDIFVEVPYTYFEKGKAQLPIIVTSDFEQKKNTYSIENSLSLVGPEIHKEHHDDADDEDE